MIERDSLGRDDGPNFGVYEGLPYVPGGPNGIMKCPSCGEHTPDAWDFLKVGLHSSGSGWIYELEAPQPHAQQVMVDWMRCANPECRELVIRLHESYRTMKAGFPMNQETASWLARPRASHRSVDPAIPEPFRSDYQEAAAILDMSPRMSAVLSRRILADLLKAHAGQDQFSLTDRIDSFAKDKSHPSQLRENLHYLREIADFGAHTQEDDQAEIINVSRQEAEWTLDLLDRLFEYFIVTPEKDRKIRAAMDEKIAEAKRKPLAPPTGEEGP